MRRAAGKPWKGPDAAKTDAGQALATAGPAPEEGSQESPGVGVYREPAGEHQTWGGSHLPEPLLSSRVARGDKRRRI